MSRDQRPPRAVVVTTASDAGLPAAAASAGDESAPVAAPASGLIIPSLVFLLACIVGAVGTALMASGVLS